MYRTLAHLFLVMTLLCMAAGTCQAGSLVAHWALDDGAGAVALDSSGNGFDGDIGGTVNWTTGMLGGALDLDGTSTFIDINTEIVRGTCTLGLWIMPRDMPYASGYRAIMHDEEWNSGSLHGHLRANTSLFNFDINGGGGVTSTTAAESDEWYHLAGTFDVEAAESKIYVNGVLESTASGLNPAVYVGPLNWGAWTDNQRFFPGAMDDIRIYSRVLGEPQVQGLMEGMEPDFSKAEDPNPADGAVAVQAPLLMWSKGETALFHNVYLGTSPDLTEADRVATSTPVTLYYHSMGLEPGGTYYWRVDEIEADQVTIHTGNVWSFTMQALTAYLPTPADGAVDASPTPDLTWLPGQASITHHVYLSDNFADVNDATAAADKGEVTDPNFAPGNLDTLTTYYWRVDEAALDGVRVGPVWTFTTYETVEDFESYDDDLEAGTAIFQTWIDGMENGTSSIVGYFESANGTFGETTIVHGGLQSMPLDYNNVNAPYYSEADRTWTPAQDWTAGGAATLTVFVRGNRSNDSAPLTVRIADTSGQEAALVHPDPEIVRVSTWTAWKIPLSALSDAGVNPAAVKKMTIGVGDRDNPVPGAAGLIYIDDIQRAQAEATE